MNAEESLQKSWMHVSKMWGVEILAGETAV